MTPRTLKEVAQLDVIVPVKFISKEQAHLMYASDSDDIDSESPVIKIKSIMENK